MWPLLLPGRNGTSPARVPRGTSWIELRRWSGRSWHRQFGCVMPDAAVGLDYKALDARSTRTARSFLRQLHAEWVPADRPTAAAVHHNRVFCWQQAGIGYVTREE